MNRHDIPPNYFYLALILTALLRYLFPQFNIIGYPLNLTGFIVVAFGMVLTYVSWKEFMDHGTSESYRGGMVCMVSEGLYAYSRNPMYVGMVLIVAGLWICMMMNLLALVGPVFLFLYSTLNSYHTRRCLCPGGSGKSSMPIGRKFEDGSDALQ